MIEVERTFPCLGLAYGNSPARREGRESFRCPRVNHASSRNDERASRRLNPFNGPAEQSGIRSSTRDKPCARTKEFFGVVVGLGLHILGERKGHSAGFHGRSEHSHRFRQGSQNLFGALDSVPVARDRTETIVDRYILSRR